MRVMCLVQQALLSAKSTFGKPCVWRAVTSYHAHFFAFIKPLVGSSGYSVVGQQQRYATPASML